jgi:Tfp pilus assembly PilM family ATPase
MLTENKIVELVCSQLERDHFSIVQKLDTNQTGIDIIAISPDGKQYEIEAKGATSSKENSFRYGKEFNKSQVKTHIGMALVASFKVKNRNQKNEAIIALPNNDANRNEIKALKIPILNSGIKVWLVDEHGIEKFI